MLFFVPGWPTIDVHILRFTIFHFTESFVVAGDTAGRLPGRAATAEATKFARIIIIVRVLRGRDDAGYEHVQ
jgi:hypothetical protein